MNEQIKKLAKQAGFVPGVMGLNRFTYFDTEKFAELIIKETLQVARAGIEQSMDDAVYRYFGVDE